MYVIVAGMPVYFTENYLCVVLGFMGLTDVTTFRLEDIFVPNMGEQAATKALKAVEEFSF